MVETTVRSVDGMDFFRHREGEWSSWRVTHHLAFKRSESGESEISMQVLDPSDERITQLCRDWKVDPSLSQGGCYVTWKATMAWDQEGENHEGSTVFALVPDEDNTRKGRILRDRGYAEIVPIAGHYHLDDDDDLILETPYEGGKVHERFSFDGPNVVNRLSTVQRFGGYGTATFATERRVGADVVGEWDVEKEGKTVKDLILELMLHGPISDGEAETEMSGKEREMQKSEVGSNVGFAGRSRWRTRNSAAPPSANSAFSTGFSSGGAGESEVKKNAGNGAGSTGLGGEVEEAARKAGVDLSKIPPSMREDFVASFQKESGQSRQSQQQQEQQTQQQQ